MSGIGEPAAVDRQAAATDAFGEPLAQPLELGDALGRCAPVHSPDSRAQSRRVGTRSGGSFASSAPISSSDSPIRCANTMKAMRRSTERG